MYTYDEECLKVFLKEQESLLGREEFTTLEEADEFLNDCMACVCDDLKDVRDYLEESGMDAYGMSDEEVISQAEVFSLSDGRYLVVEG